MMATTPLRYIINLLLTGFVYSNNAGYYAIPEPNIVAFENGGIRVTLKDVSGISVFRFHANVNDEMKQLYPGTINIESSAKINGKWLLEDRSVKIRVGDILYYWLFVEKDRLGYVKQPVKLRITELVPYYTEEGNNEVTETPRPPPLITSLSPMKPSTRTTEAPLTPTACSPSTSDISLSSLQNQIDNLNRKIDLVSSISALQGQVDTLSKKFDGINGSPIKQLELTNISRTIELILTTLENIPETRRLTLSGYAPPDDSLTSPEHTVRLVIKEKLDLQVSVVTALRKKDGSIVFELSTLKEKFDVLNAAQEKLKGTRIVISIP